MHHITWPNRQAVSCRTKYSVNTQSSEYVVSSMLLKNQGYLNIMICKNWLSHSTSHDQRFQSTKTPVFVRKHFEQLLCSILLIF